MASAEYPSLLLRHQNDVVKLESMANVRTQASMEDATWRVIEADDDGEFDLDDDVVYDEEGSEVSTTDEESDSD